MYNQITTDHDVAFNNEPSAAIRSMHNIWRFGNTDQISRLASPVKETRDEYMVGVIALNIILMLFFFSWVVCLITPKIRGAEKAGCLSGRITHFSYRESQSRAESKHTRIQWLFLFVGFVLIIMCGFLLSAIPKLEKSAKEIIELNKNVQSAVDEALIVATNSHIAEQRLQHNNTLESILNQQDVCPGFETLPFLNEVGINATISSIKDSILIVRGYMAQHQIPRIISHLKDIKRVSIAVGKFVGTYDDNDFLAKMFAIITAIITMFLMATCLVSYSKTSFEPLQRMTSYCVIPILIGCTSIGIIFTFLTLVGSMMNADFCAGGENPGSPQATVADAMLEFGIQKHDLTYQSLLYYQSECKIPIPWQYVSQYGAEIETGIKSTLSLTTFFEGNGVANITDLCGTDISPLVESLRRTTGDLTILSDSLQQAIELARCGRVRPLYLKLFYGTTCKESAEGFTISFAGFLVIAICGLTMITLRSALYDAEVIDDQSFEKENDQCLARIQDNPPEMKPTFETESVASAYSNENEDNKSQFEFKR